WLAGDLVNRGPHSLEVVRRVKSLGDAAVTVLGNHDLYLLMVAEDVARRGRDDTCAELLAAPDRDELLDWLAHRSMIHVEDGRVLVHAGLAPQWDVPLAARLGREVEAALRGPKRHALLKHLHGDKPAGWSEG